MKDIDEGMSGIDIKFVLSSWDYYSTLITEVIVYFVIALNIFQIVPVQTVILACLFYIIGFIGVIFRRICVKAE